MILGIYSISRVKGYGLAPCIEDRMVFGETTVTLEVGCISFAKFHLTSNDSVNHIEIIQISPLKGHDFNYHATKS